MQWQRSKTAWLGPLLFAVATSYIGYVLFEQPEPQIWLAFWWIIFLFLNIQSFAQVYSKELVDRPLYYYTLAGALPMVVGKYLALTIRFLLLSAVMTAVMAFFIGWPVLHLSYFISAWIIGGLGSSLILNITALLSERNQQLSGGLSILALPLLIPMLLGVLRLSLKSIRPVIDEWSWSEITMPLAIILLLTAITILMAPYVWKD